MTEKQFEKWGHYELIDTHKDLNDENIYKKTKKGVAKK